MVSEARKVCQQDLPSAAPPTSLHAALSFVPFSENAQDTLVKIAKKLKKNSVAVDVVSFGCEAENDEKLTAFHEAVNSSNNSHLVTVPPGPVLSDVLIGSPIFQGEGAAFGAAAGSAEGLEFGVDPNMDPELALALRVSMEEERARQTAASAASGGGDEPQQQNATEGQAPEATKSQPAQQGGPAAGRGGPEGMDMDEDTLLQQALQMSLEGEKERAGDGTQQQRDGPPPQQAAPPPQQQQQQQQQTGPSGQDTSVAENVEDEELQRALQMSMQDSGPQVSLWQGTYM